MSYNDLRKGRISQPGTVYHITAVSLGRMPHFADFDTGRKVVRELKALQTQGKAETLCYVLMPDHLHWLMQLQSRSLAELMQQLKGRSARAVGHALWQPGYHDHALREGENLRNTARYIVANPLRAGLVERIGDYPLWDAVWLDDTLSA